MIGENRVEGIGHGVHSLVNAAHDEVRLFVESAAVPNRVHGEANGIERYAHLQSQEKR